MAAKLAKTSRLIRELLFGGHRGPGFRRILVGDVPVCLSGSPESGRLLLVSPGFGSCGTDYGPVVRHFERDHLVLRVAHPQDNRLAALLALTKLLWQRMRGSPGLAAAREVRAWLHGEKRCLRRLDQMKDVATWASQEFSCESLSVLGHSFGTDTVLRYTLEHEVDFLYLLSPHPPGYLIPEPRYRELRCSQLYLVTGTNDRTRDGVGSGERYRVTEKVSAEILVQATVLPGVGHMDFAFQGLGPVGWEQALIEALGRDL